MDDDSTRIYHRNHAKETIDRLVRCINVCDGLDDVVLDVLSTKGSDGDTLLKYIINKIDLYGAYDNMKNKHKPNESDEPG